MAVRDRDDDSESARVIVVVGMHRSGTSLVTRGLNALGVPLGDNVLTRSAPDNEKGHWEDVDVREFNERLMASLALQWDVIGAGDEAAMGAESLMPAVEEGRALVESKLGGSRSWAFKDPRIGRLWPFWRRVLVGDPQWRVAFVWAVRHPVSVARSLRHRNGFGPLKSHLLWMSHNLAPYRDIAAHRHAVVDYDLMLAQPRVELARMAESLELDTTGGDSVDVFVDEFVDSRLRHFDHVGESDARPVSVGVEHAACVAYEALRRVSTGADSLDGSTFRAEWHGAFEEAGRFAGSAARVDLSTLAERGLHEAEARLERELQEGQAAGFSQLQEQVTETLQDQFTVLSGRIEDAGTRLRRAQQESQTAGLERLRDQVTGTLQEQFGALSGRIEEAESRLRREQQESQTAGLERLRESQTADLARLQDQVTGTLREQFGALSGRIEQTEDRLRREQRESQAAGLDRLEAQIAATLREQIAVLSGRIDEVRARSAQTREELALLNELLDRERFSVVKPILRRAYRLGVAVTRRMPGPVERRLRQLKRKLIPGSVALTADIVRTDTQPVAGRGSRPAVDFGQPLAGHHDMLVFPVIDWHFRFQRPQHLARQLAEPRAPGVLSLHDIPQRRPAHLSGVRIACAERLSRHPLHPRQAAGHLSGPDVRGATRATRGRGRRADFGRWPPEHDRDGRSAVLAPAGGIRARAVVGLRLHGLPRRILHQQPGTDRGGDKLIASADLVVTSSAGLSEIVGRSRENVLIRNAGEIAYFRESPPRLAYESDRPVAGYLGAIAEWFDMDLVASAARRYPDWDFVLVGSTDYGDVSKVRKLANVS